MIDERQRQTLIDVVTDLAGEEAKQVTLVLLNAKDEITDEEISEELDMRLNQVRKALYSLYDIQLASFRRIRDKQTGWFVYYWNLHPDRIYSIVQKRQSSVLDKLGERLRYEENNMFFTCGTPGCKRYSFDEGMQEHFICPECGEKLDSFDNSYTVYVLKQKIQTLNDMMAGKKPLKLSDF